MELFVINRPEDEEARQVTAEEEKCKLDKVLKQIERRKKLRQKQKDRDKHQSAIKTKIINERQHKRELKQKIVPVPENKLDDFINVNSPESEAPKKPNLEGFTVLGAANSAKKAKVKRVLPQWLSNPTVISSNLQELKVKVSSVKNLDKTLRKQLKLNGIKYFFPVQSEVIPWLLQVNQHVDVMFPRDICVSAPTGSGKTLAFVLPVVQALKRHSVRRIRALVILPTQDLASQVFKAFQTYTRDTNLEICLITGKNVFEHEQKQLVYRNQAFGYVSKVDILVCTAGRLVNHLKSTEGFNLQSLEFLIIDEADRVLDNVQDDWLYHLEKHIYQDDLNPQSGKVLNVFSLRNSRPPQKLLFSATLSQDPEKLQKLSLFQPKLFTCVTENETESETYIGRFTTPRELSEKYIVCSKDLKPLVLYKFIKTEELTKTVIFTHSVESAHRLSLLLKSLFKDKLKIEEISSNLTGKSRDNLITNFSKGQVDLLICTDALARGIDLPGVKCVISYSAPKYLKTYIHRAGRTARAGEFGWAVTLLHTEQVSQFRQLLSHCSKSNVDELEISEGDLEPLGKLYQKALNKLKDSVASEQKTGLRKLKAKKSVKVKKVV